ncbi:hypothetical protein ACFQ7F_35115 [Streptomyces sp. NPDC056486]|uniref:hypothetical protein n=1 Tax=Streptomyces sp. NPDC056486 TaxID=3345835 RepID=UPI0036CE71A3
MEPISLILALLVSSFAAGAALAQVTWNMVEAWIHASAIQGGYANILANRLTDGDYHVVGGVFTPTGVRIAIQTWTAHDVDPELVRKLRTSGGIIRVQT